jgi:hypothetical protein
MSHLHFLISVLLCFSLLFILQLSMIYIFLNHLLFQTFVHHSSLRPWVIMFHFILSIGVVKIIAIVYFIMNSDFSLFRIAKFHRIIWNQNLNREINKYLGTIMEIILIWINLIILFL